MVAVGLGMESLGSSDGENFDVRQKKETVKVRIFLQNRHVPICILNLGILVIMRLLAVVLLFNVQKLNLCGLPS